MLVCSFTLCYRVLDAYTGFLTRLQTTQHTFPSDSKIEQCTCRQISQHGANNNGHAISDNTVYLVDVAFC